MKLKVDREADACTCVWTTLVLLNLRKSLQAGHSTDGVEGNVTGFDPIVPSCQGVAKLVQNHAAKHGRDHHDHVQGKMNLP